MMMMMMGHVKMCCNCAEICRNVLKSAADVLVLKCAGFFFSLDFPFGVLTLFPVLELMRSYQKVQVLKCAGAVKELKCAFAKTVLQIFTCAINSSSFFGPFNFELNFEEETSISFEFSASEIDVPQFMSFVGHYLYPK